VAKHVPASTVKRQFAKRRLVSLGLVVVVVMLILAVAWFLATPAPQKAVVGRWTNSHGGTVDFYANGKGFIPGVSGVISDTNFSYTFPDSQHVSIDMSGQALTVGIKIAGDKMTWSNGLNNTVDVYTRIP
jgi:hypothetical protein